MLVSIILFCLINSISCLTCIHSKEKSFAFNSSNDFEFENTINNFPIQQAIHKKCHVKLTINYTNNRFYIAFPKEPLISNNKIKIETNILSIDRPLKDQNVIMSVIYTCIGIDECNRHYVLEHLPTMIVMNYSKTQEKLFQLLSVKSKGKFLCYVSPPKNFICEGKLCRATENEDGTLDASCASKKSTTTHVDISVSMKNDQQQKSIEYVRNFAGCNNQTTFKDIKKSVQSYQKQLSKFLQSNHQQLLTEVVKTSKGLPLLTTTNKYISSTNNDELANNAIFRVNISLTIIVFALFIVLYIE